MNSLTIVAAQLNFRVGDLKGNAERMITEAHRAYQKQHADIIVFPELALTSYPPQDLLYRPAIYDECKKLLQKIAEETREITVILGYPEWDGEQRFNSAAILQNGKIIANYRKQQLPNYTVFDEKRYFATGDTSCVFNVKEFRIGLLICEDLWFEEPLKKTVTAGAEYVIVINGSPFSINQAQKRNALLKKQTQLYQKPIIYVNHVGGQDELIFDGGSMAYDAKGQLIAKAPYFEEALITVNLPITSTKSLAETFSSEFSTIYSALTLSLRDYVNKNHFSGVIIGLSGGIDSALTLAIAHDALGSEHVTAVMMPSRYNAEISLEDAKKLAETLHIHYDIIDIEPIFKTFLDALHPVFKKLPTDTTEENLQARIRGTLLMAISNKTGRMVLNTSNKSEMAVGYGTLYGDMVGGFSLLKDILKTTVYRLAKYRNQISPVIPERILTREPSAELAFNQKDQDTLPPYDILDKIIDLYMVQDHSSADIVQAGFDAETVKKVIKMIYRNEYKRQQAPIGPRITERAFGKDRRYPVTSSYSES